MSASIAQRLHESLHALPGMPPHTEAARRNQNPGAHHPGRRPGHHPGRRSAARRRSGLVSLGAHHSRPPRILVGWQTWIGQRFAGRDRRG